MKRKTKRITDTGSAGATWGDTPIDHGHDQSSGAVLPDNARRSVSLAPLTPQDAPHAPNGGLPAVGTLLSENQMVQGAAHRGTEIGCVNLEIVAKDTQEQVLTYTVPIYRLPSGQLFSAWHNCTYELVSALVASDAVRATFDVPARRTRILDRLPVLFSVIKGVFSSKSGFDPLSVPALIGQIGDLNTSFPVVVSCAGLELEGDDAFLASIASITPRRFMSHVQLLDSTVASDPKVWGMVVQVLRSDNPQEDGDVRDAGYNMSGRKLNNWGL